MTKLEILNSIKEKRLKVAEILDTIGMEKREATNVEKITMEALNDEIKQLETESRNVNTKQEKTLVISNDSNENESFSLRNYLINIKNNRLNDFENELNKRFGGDSKSYVLPTSFEIRTISAGSNGQTIATDKYDLLTPLFEKSLIGKLNMTVATDLVGKISVPRMSTGLTAYWKSELDEAVDAGGGFEEIELNGFKLTGYMPISMKYLKQNTPNTELKLKNTLINTVLYKYLTTIFSADNTDGTKPAGLFYGATYTVTGATSWEKIVSLETKCKTQNVDADQMYYLISPDTLAKLKTTPKATGLGFIAENGTINGYKYIVTNTLPNISTGKGIAFGDFSELYLAMWNNIEITVDNLTSARAGIINYIINYYVDFANARPENIALGWLS